MQFLSSGSLADTLLSGKGGEVLGQGLRCISLESLVSGQFNGMAIVMGGSELPPTPVPRGMASCGPVLC